MKQNKTIKITKKKAVAIVFVLALIGFSIYNIMWFSYVKKFDVFLYNENLQAIKYKPVTAPDFVVLSNGVEIPYSYERYTFFESDGWKSYSFRDCDYNEHGYSYSIVIPPYLKFGGNIQISHQTEELRVSVILSPKDWVYYLDIGEISDNHIYSYGSLVDRNGKPIDPDIENEHIKTWLELYEKHNEPIRELFEAAREMYGDALQ
ncbi:MAG: hypothetical protein FWG91_02240 [Lachnospiraceae bacterium]|nr:hypothetical protein [Lachnospiraceae bacterium]